MARPYFKTTKEYFDGSYEVCPTSGCWNWNRSMYSFGYGRIPIKINGKWAHRPAHRIGYILLVGPIPEGMQANHKCDNRRCVNPAHIYIGTQKQNVRDCILRNRNSKGEKHPISLLSEDSVRFIRSNYIPRHPTFGFSALARKFGVNDETVRDAYIGKTWKHIEFPKEEK